MSSQLKSPNLALGPSAHAPAVAAASTAAHGPADHTARANRAEHAEQARERSHKNSRAFLFRLTLGGLIGGSLGFAYYYFIGCSSGHCLIGANPFLSAIFGGLFGLNLAALVFPPKR